MDNLLKDHRWPTWDLPILRWAESQGALAGFAHSGRGLEVKSTELPNHDIPGFDSIGANEYIVDVTHPGIRHAEKATCIVDCKCDT